MNFYKWKNFLKIIFKGQAIYLLTLFTLQFLGGISPIVIAWLNSKLIDSIFKHKSYISNGNVSTKIIILIISSSIIITSSDLFIFLQNFLSDYFDNLIFKRIQLKLLDAISNYPTNHIFEDSKISDRIVAAKEGAKMVSEYISITSRMLLISFGLISSIAFGFSIAWWLPFILLTTMIPFIYYRTKVENRTWNVKENYGHIFNKLSLYGNILTTSEFSKDIRLYKMQDKFLKKWESLYNKYFNDVNDIRVKGALKAAACSLISVFGILIAFWFVTISTINGIISFGKLGFLLGIIIQINIGITCLMYNSSDIIKALLMTKPILSILDIKDETIQKIEPLNSYSEQKSLIFFDKVSFKYPGSKEYAIKNLSFSLKDGESLAFVGENGSGKSTLLKLICRLYTPTSGKIYWKGRDISSYDFDEYRANIAVLFQDFAKFPVSVRENIETNQEIIYSENFIIKTLEQVDLKFLTDKLDTTLFKGVENGIDLSGGEWQRLALVRLLVNMDNRSLLMFDEPSASLDPNTEHKVLSLLINKIVKNKTTIITSHRLALCQFVNNIIVLDKGNIKEQGNHKELIDLKSTYYNMFQRQSSWFRN